MTEHDRAQRRALQARPLAERAIVGQGHYPSNANTAEALSSSPGLPLPRLLRRATRSTVYYTVTTIDARGRLADRSALRVLCWEPCQRYTLTVSHDAVVATRDVDGPAALTRQGHLRLPSALRHRFRLVVGDRLLLAGCTERQLLVAAPTEALDLMLQVLVDSAEVPR